MINKFISAVKYIWKNLLWLPVAVWIVGSIFTQKPAEAFDAGINAPAIFYSGDIAPSTAPFKGVAVATQTPTVDMYDRQFNTISAQINYSSFTMRTVTFTDGTPSTATITIASNTALAAATSWITISVGSNTALNATTAYITIVISSNSALDKAQLTLTLSSSPFSIAWSSFSVAPYVTYSTPTFPSVQLAQASYTFVEGRDWYRSGGIGSRTVDFASQTAVNIAAALNFSTYGITASTGFLGMPPYISTGSNSQNGIVIIMARSYGRYANPFQLQSSTQFAMTVCYSTAGNGLPNLNQFASTPTAFTGGRDPAFIRVTSTATFTYIAGRDFAVDPLVLGSSGTATSIALALSITSQSAVGFVASTATMFGTANAFLNQFSTAIYGPSVVFLRAVTPGTFANSWSVTSSTQFALTVAYSTGVFNLAPNPAFTLARSSALNFNGGLDNVVLKVNGIPLVIGQDWFVGSVASATALSISSAIAFNVRLTTNVVVSTASMFTGGYSIVYCTSAFINHNEFNIYSSSNFALVVSTDPGGSVYADGSSTGSFKGGSLSNIDTGTVSISATNNFAPGMAVWLSTQSGQTPPGRLTFGTTYFVCSPSGSNLSPTKFSLSHTSTGAANNIPYVTGVATQNALGGNTYTLQPVGWSSAAVITWQFSNDGQNWFGLSGPSITINSTTMPGTTFYDFGSASFAKINYRYLRQYIWSAVGDAINVVTNIFGKY